MDELELATCIGRFDRVVLVALSSSRAVKEKGLLLNFLKLLVKV